MSKAIAQIVCPQKYSPKFNSIQNTKKNISKVIEKNTNGREASKLNFEFVVWTVKASGLFQNQ